jgi:hypothetical protein
MIRLILSSFSVQVTIVNETRETRNHPSFFCEQRNSQIIDLTRTVQKSGFVLMTHFVLLLDGILVMGERYGINRTGGLDLRGAIQRSQCQAKRSTV